MNIKTIGLQIIATTALLTTTHNAFALSCIRPDPVQECKQMQSENMSPIWANGQLQLKKVISQEKKEMNIGGKGPAVAEYRFTGSISDKSGKRDVKDAKILISTSCAGPWCANLPRDKTSGYFLLKTDAKAGLRLHLGACSFQPFTVTDQQAKEIETCVTPKPVKPEPVKPKTVKNKGSSQMYTQHNKGKSLVK